MRNFCSEVIHVKKRITMLLLAGMTTAALSFSALAAEVSGLSAFLDTRSYSEGAFSDVGEEAWYSSGVKTVYEKGIMDGVGGGRFEPSGTVTWAQAVTIAARLHATYHGDTVDGTGDVWYEGYAVYAERVGILPSTAPDGTELAERQISRQELAGLFHNVLSEKDLPAVNDMVIPDLAEVLPEFRQAVCDMYAAGIFTGKDEGRFDPEGNATRAEIAAVVTRLLSPGQRRSFDSRADRNMSGQWGNYKSGGFAAQYGDTVYYTVRERADEDSWTYLVVARKNSGETRVVYETASVLTRLAAAEDGLLYFIEKQSVLCSLDPVTGETKGIYTSPAQLEHFVFYDGEIYIFECYSASGSTSEWKCRIGLVRKNSLTILVNNMDYPKVSTLDILHAYNGKLYYCCGDEKGTSGSFTLWSLDLTTKKTRRENAENIFKGEICFSGAVYWHIRERDDGLYEILRGSLVMDREEVLAVLPEDATLPYPYLYANGDDLFFQSSGAGRLWKIDPAGAVEEVAKLPGNYYERSSVVGQGIVIHALETLSALMPQQIVVQLPDSGCENYLKFLNRPYWENGSALYEVDGQEVAWDSPMTEEGPVTTEIRRGYYTAEGDLVMELTVCNGLAAEITPLVITLTLADGQREIHTVFYRLDNVAAGSKTTVSLVVTAEKLNGAFDLRTVEKTVSLKYSKKG